jgi:uncharacterized protein
MAPKGNINSYIRRYIREVSQIIKIDSAFLFGSYARNQQHKYSDIDIALVSDDFTDNPIYNRRILSSLSFKFHRIEFHPFTPGDFKKRDPLAEEIKKTGIPISNGAK